MRKYLNIVLLLVFCIGLLVTFSGSKGINGLFGVANGFETSRTKFKEYFLLYPDDLIKSFNEEIAKKGYQPFTVLKKSSDTRILYSDNGETWFIAVDLIGKVNSIYGIDSNAALRVGEIKLDLFSDSEERAKKNGDLIYEMINLFNPGMQEKICKKLHVFDKAPSGIANIRRVVCGNVLYTFVHDKGNGDYSSSSLIITPDEIEYKPKHKPAAIKPTP